jgi:hypothetical protein
MLHWKRSCCSKACHHCQCVRIVTSVPVYVTRMSPWCRTHPEKLASSPSGRRTSMPVQEVHTQSTPVSKQTWYGSASQLLLSGAGLGAKDNPGCVGMQCPHAFGLPSCCVGRACRWLSTFAGCNDITSVWARCSAWLLVPTSIAGPSPLHATCAQEEPDSRACTSCHAPQAASLRLLLNQGTCVQVLVLRFQRTML